MVGYSKAGAESSSGNIKETIGGYFQSLKKHGGPFPIRLADAKGSVLQQNFIRNDKLGYEVI
jgi:hypothetical protein